jgi:hypothetical protein
MRLQKHRSFNKYSIRMQEEIQKICFRKDWRYYTIKTHDVRYRCLIVVIIFWDVMTCNKVDVYRRFVKTKATTANIFTFEDYVEKATSRPNN